MPERKQSPASVALEAAIAEELRVLMARKQPRVTQVELADAFGWKQSWLSKRLNGHRSLDIPHLLNICDYLGVDVTTVLAAAKQNVAARSSTD